MDCAWMCTAEGVGKRKHKQRGKCLKENQGKRSQSGKTKYNTLTAEPQPKNPDLSSVLSPLRTLNWLFMFMSYLLDIYNLLKRVYIKMIFLMS